VELRPVDVRDAGEIERAVTAFARSPNGGLILTGSGPSNVHRDLIITLAARHRLPAVYFDHSMVAAGGLISYVLILSTCSAKRPAMSIVSSKARSLRTFQFRRRLDTRW
jgi:hypothetical protein